MSNSEWKSSLLNFKEDMKAAINNLEAGNSGISIIVNDKNKLVGTVTDGDIRRAILSNFTMESKIESFMNKNPIFLDSNYERGDIINLMKEKDILQIPITDKNKTIIGLETLNHLLNKQKADNPVFLMAGGFGTRLTPLTHETPKPLLKIGSKPILERIISKFIDAGFHRFYISTHFKAEKIKEHFNDGSDWDVSIKYIDEDKPLGTAGSLGLLPKLEMDLPVIVMNGDLLSDINFHSLLNYHKKKKGIVTMGISKYEFQIPYGVIIRDEDKFIEIEEKPSENFFINAGIYVIEPLVIKALDGKTYLDMPNLLNKIKKDKGEVNVFPIHEYWLDVGQIKDLKKAKKDLANEN